MQIFFIIVLWGFVLLIVSFIGTWDSFSKTSLIRFSGAPGLWPELMLAMKVWVEYWSACILFVYDQFINCQTIIEIIECMQYKYVLYNYNCIQICQSRVLFCRGIRKSCGCSGNFTLVPLRRICRIREDLCLWVYRMFVFFVSYLYWIEAAPYDDEHRRRLGRCAFDINSCVPPGLVSFGLCPQGVVLRAQDIRMKIVQCELWKGCLDCRHEKVNGEGGLCLYVGFGTRAIMTNTGVDSWSSVLILRALISSGFDIASLA